MTLTQIVMKLIGPVQPTYCSMEDAKRSKNIDELINLIDDLLREIIIASEYETAQEESAQIIGKKASNCLKAIKE